jgi:hypothetical protein
VFHVSEVNPSPFRSHPGPRGLFANERMCAATETNGAMHVAPIYRSHQRKLSEILAHAVSEHVFHQKCFDVVPWSKTERRDVRKNPPQKCDETVRRFIELSRPAGDVSKKPPPIRGNEVCQGQIRDGCAGRDKKKAPVPNISGSPKRGRAGGSAPAFQTGTRIIRTVRIHHGERTGPSSDTGSCDSRGMRAFAVLTGAIDYPRSLSRVCRTARPIRKLQNWAERLVGPRVG